LQEIKTQGPMCKWRWDAGVQLQFTQGLDCKTSKCQGSKRKWPLTSALFIFFTRKQEENGCLYCIKIHATAWHSLVIKTREGEPQKEEKRKKSHARQGGRQKKTGGEGRTRIETVFLVSSQRTGTKKNKQGNR